MSPQIFISSYIRIQRWGLKAMLAVHSANNLWWTSPQAKCLYRDVISKIHIFLNRNLAMVLRIYASSAFSWTDTQVKCPCQDGHLKNSYLLHRNPAMRLKSYASSAFSQHLVMNQHSSEVSLSRCHLKNSSLPKLESCDETEKLC